MSKDHNWDRAKQLCHVKKLDCSPRSSGLGEEITKSDRMEGGSSRKSKTLSLTD